MTNDIAGAFNCVMSRTLTEIMTHYKMPEYLVQLVSSFTSDRKVSIFLKGKMDGPTPISAGLPQGSPLSPVLFILDGSAILEKHTTAMEKDTCYVDDDVLLQGATSVKTARASIENRINRKLARAKVLNM